MRAAVAALGVGLALAPSWASGQTRVDGAGEVVPPVRGADELVALMLTSTTYGMRTGTALDVALGVGRDHDLYWLAPGILGAAGLTAGLLIDHRWPVRRGRALTAGACMLVAQVGALSWEMYSRRETFPSSQSFLAPSGWFAATAGLGTGILVGALVDVKPGAGVYVGLAGVGGALVGVFSSGLARRNDEVGLWAMVGEGVGLAAALSTAWYLDPPGREMRAAVVGTALGVVPAAGVVLAHWVRDGAIDADAWARVSGVGLAGVVLGGLTGYGIARATRPPRGSGDTYSSVSVLPGAQGSLLGLSLVGEM